jgi:hypothetical protein
MKTFRLRAILSDLIRSCRIYGAFKRLGQVHPSKDKRGRVRQRLGWQGRRCWPTTRGLTQRAPRQRFAPIGTWGFLPISGGMVVPSVPRNMLRLCHISDMDIDYAECRCAGGGRPVAARRANGTPDYGDAGIYREGHRASSKAKPRRDATSVPRSSERPICRCRGQIGPESDGAAPTSTRSHKAERRGHAARRLCGTSFRSAGRTD